MQIIREPSELQRQCLKWRGQGQSIALVPTMGFFHAGHESLMQKARTLADKVVVTLFVNPTQFGPTEDLDQYPKNFANDSAIAKSHGVDLLFAPINEAMYSPDHATWVEVPSLGTELCGKSRPIHFRGVCTVVSKLFLLTQPHYACFGEKDWQQLAIIRRMTRDLFFPIEIIGVPIYREPDGLAMSSRNAYLAPEERAAAPYFQKGLQKVEALFKAGERDCVVLRAEAIKYWETHLPMGQLDYCTCVDPEQIAPLQQISASAIMAAAMRLGKARILDNILLK